MPYQNVFFNNIAFNKKNGYLVLQTVAPILFTCIDEIDLFLSTFINKSIDK